MAVKGKDPCPDEYLCKNDGNVVIVLLNKEKVNKHIRRAFQHTGILEILVYNIFIILIKRFLKRKAYNKGNL